MQQAEDRAWMPHVGQYRPNPEHTREQISRKYTFGAGKKSLPIPYSVINKAPCLKQSLEELSPCNIHSRKVVKLKEIQMRENAQMVRDLEKLKTKESISATDIMMRDKEIAKVKDKL